MSSFKELGLSAEILRAIADQGYTQPTPIQAQAIPSILSGKDLMGGAQTGTGKTAGFTLPMLNLLQPHASSSVSPARHPIRALILVPTRELAMQVFESVKTYGKYVPLKCALVYGGVNMDAQIKELRGGVEILVATPGRLLDHVGQKTVNLSQVQILVLDEADRMLDMGFLPDIKRILALLPAKRQSLMFSATFSDEIKRLADTLLKQPVLVEVARRNALSELVTHVVYPVAREHKRELLAHLIKSHDLKQVLVFVRTKHGASRLAQQLEKDGITATDIHGDRSQIQRTQALEDFKQGTVRVLVATDVAARGLDIVDLPHVVNFELPNTPEDYIHRIGRTGRAGSKGDAISLMYDDEKELLAEIEKLLKTKITVENIAGFEAGHTSSAAPSSHRGRPVRAAADADVRGRSENKPRDRQRQQPAAHAAAPSRPRSHPHPAAGHAKKTADPLFSQPYVSAEPSGVAATTADHQSPAAHPRHGHAKKPLPALFKLPVRDKLGE